MSRRRNSSVLLLDSAFVGALEVERSAQVQRIKIVANVKFKMKFKKAFKTARITGWVPAHPLKLLSNPGYCPLHFRNCFSSSATG